MIAIPISYFESLFIKNPYFLWVGVVSMSVKEVSLYFLGGVPI